MADEKFSRDGPLVGGTADDLTAASGEALRGDLARLAEEERDLAARLELVRGRLGLIRAELAGRGLASVGVEELARVLLGEEWGRGTF